MTYSASSSALLGEYTRLFQKIDTIPDPRRITIHLLGEFILLLAEYPLFWDIFIRRILITWDRTPGEFWENYLRQKDSEGIEEP